MSEYLALRLTGVPGAADEWAAYVETSFQNITDPQHLVEWWEGRPSSLFKDHVLFLIAVLMETGSLERFFSFAKHTGADQRHGLHGNGRRLAIMTHCNGDLEGRLD